MNDLSNLSAELDRHVRPAPPLHDLELRVASRRRRARIAFGATAVVIAGVAGSIALVASTSDDATHVSVADGVADGAAVRQAIETVFAGNVPLDRRIDAIDGGSSIRNALEQADRHYAGLFSRTTLSIDQVAFRSPDTAEVTFMITLPDVGPRNQVPLSGTVVRSASGRWLVSTSTVCGVLGRVGIPCSGERAPAPPLVLPPGVQAVGDAVTVLTQGGEAVQAVPTVTGVCVRFADPVSPATACFNRPGAGDIAPARTSYSPDDGGWLFGVVGADVSLVRFTVAGGDSTDATPIADSRFSGLKFFLLELPRGGLNGVARGLDSSGRSMSEAPIS